MTQSTALRADQSPVIANAIANAGTTAASIVATSTAPIKDATNAARWRRERRRQRLR